MTNNNSINNIDRSNDYSHAIDYDNDNFNLEKISLVNINKGQL